MWRPAENIEIRTRTTRLLSNFLNLTPSSDLASPQRLTPTSRAKRRLLTDSPDGPPKPDNSQVDGELKGGKS